MEPWRLKGLDNEKKRSLFIMKKHFILFAMAVMALCATFVSCGDKTNENQFVGVYDLEMVYDSITTSDGVWFSEEFFEQMTGKINPPRHGYLTVAQGEAGKFNVTATLINDETGEEKNFFATTATEVDDILILDNCTSDYYYSTTEEMISFVFRNFANNMPKIYFKSVYTINLGYDYSYLTSYNCTKRSK